MEPVAVNFRCERCRRRMRQILVVPYLGTYVEDWYHDERTGKTRYVSEIDEDVCAPCGEKIVAACEAYYRDPGGRMKPAPPPGTPPLDPLGDLWAAEQAALDALDAELDAAGGEAAPPPLPDGARNLLRVWWADEVRLHALPIHHPATAALRRRVEAHEHALERCLATTAMKRAARLGQGDPS